MHILNSKRVWIDRPITVGGVLYPHLYDNALRESMGVVEVPDPAPPVDYSPGTYSREDIEDAPYVIYARQPLEQIEAAKVALVQQHMDAAAQALNYDSIATACTYADEPAVPKFQAEGQAFRAWRSQVWAACYVILADVQAGTRGIPTDAELIAELPALQLPE